MRFVPVNFKRGCIQATSPTQHFTQKKGNDAMSFAELMPALQTLPRAEKLRVIQFLVTDLTREQGIDLLQEGASYPIWTPYEAHDAARILLQLLEQERVV
jgi:hypothetical protein